MIAQVYFWIFSLAALAGALGVLFSRHPLQGALSLIGTMVSLAGIFSLVGSPFLATLQILVYAGAIIMLLVFVIMVLNSAKDDKTPRWDLLGSFWLLPAASVGATLVRILLASDARHPLSVPASAPPASRATVEVISGKLFGAGFGAWSFLFLVVGLLLLSAIVGAVLLAKRHLDSPVREHHHTSGGH